ncbi:MAG: hypothetical protein CFE29_01635 [Bradyrhizobiaceae bacterium PARB1]|nr:MAG: hypothetical protein CFE29_01635 [Bradyrhizobiaceae bacterium PARB1]
MHPLNSLDFLAGGGRMGTLIRSHDWAATSLGAPEAWPQSLRSALSICLNSSFPTAIYWGPDLRLLYNDAWSPIPGERHPWALGRPAKEVWTDIWHVVGPHFERVVTTGEGFSTFDQMLPMARETGIQETYWNYSITPIRREDGSVAGIFNQGHETTDKVLADKKREAETARQRRLFEQAPGFITILKGPEHLFEFVNDSYRRLFGERHYVGRTVREVFPELRGQGFFEWLDEVFNSGERFVAQRVPAVLKKEDGADEMLLLDFIYAPVLDDRGEVTGIFCEGHDVSAAHKAERRLDDKRRALEILNRIAVTTVAETDLEKIVQLVTDAGVELTGAGFGAFFYNVTNKEGGSYMLYALSGVDRESFSDFPMPRRTAIFAPTFDGTGVLRSDNIRQDPRYGHNLPHIGMPEGHLTVVSYLSVPVVSRDGTVIGGLFFGHPERARFTVQHEEVVVGLAAQAALAISNARLIQSVQEANETLEQRVAARTAELTEAHEALRQAHKMEAVGQLTGGIAHDFNNLLTGIIGGLEIIERRLNSGRTEGIERFIRGAQTSAQRAAALTQRLLAFSRRQTLDPKPTDVNRLVAGMEDLIRRSVGPNIQVDAVPADRLWTAFVDGAQLENTLLNLAINAREAMPDGGKLTISTGNISFDEREAAENELTPGQYLAIRVSDTGSGIPADVLGRIFDPFFTTKPIGQGTGLGLSMVHGFVHQSGGRVRVNTETGRGTTMSVYLPRHLGEVDAETAASGLEAEQAAQRDVVLVVDDEPDVRMMVVEILQEAGHSVLEAIDAKSGLRILESEVRIDLLVTDVGLPDGMNGRQLADAARVGRPHMKVLFITGYAENAAVGNGHLEQGMAVMTKPFVMAEFAEKVTEMLQNS